MLITGNGVEKNEYEGEKYLKMAIEKGHAESMFLYAEMNENYHFFDDALKYYKMAFDNGYSNAKEKYEYLKKMQGITSTKSLPSLNKLLISNFNKVDERGKYNFLNAECFNDHDSNFYIGMSLIYGLHEFIKNTKFGLIYLDKACKKKNPSAIKELIDFLLTEENHCSIYNRSKYFDIFNDLITITNLTELKMKFVDILLSKESFDVDKNDRNISINYVLIKQLCEECAELGNVKAMVKYANFCMKEKKSKFGEIHNNYTFAYNYFLKAAKNGDGEGMFQCGRFYAFGFGGIKKNPEKALEYFKNSYEKGDLNGYAFYGMSLIEGTGGIIKNIPEGIRLIKYSCDQKNLTGMNIYAHYLFYGLEGLPEDKKLSFYYTKIAADLGNAKALRDLGVFYQEGTEVEKDINKSVKYFKMAIEEGDIHAAYLLGDLLRNGDEESDFEIDIVEGNKYLEFAADHGDEFAMFDILFNVILQQEDMNISNIKLSMYLNKGVESKNKDIIDLYGTALYCKWILHYDEKKAAEFIKMAADLGNENSIKTYAEFLETGFGVEKNLEEAKRYREMIIDDDDDNNDNE